MNTDHFHCSLCDESVPSQELHTHQQDASDEIVQYTLNMIKSRHPEWTEGDPSCKKCWDFYRNL